MSTLSSVRLKTVQLLTAFGRAAIGTRTRIGTGMGFAGRTHSHPGIRFMLVPVTQEINKQQHREKSKSGHEHWIFFAECNPTPRDPKMHNGPQLWFCWFSVFGYDSVCSFFRRFCPLVQSSEYSVGQCLHAALTC